MCMVSLRNISPFRDEHVYRRNLYSTSKILPFKFGSAEVHLTLYSGGLQVTCNNIIVNCIVLHLHVGQWAVFNTFK